MSFKTQRDNALRMMSLYGEELAIFAQAEAQIGEVPEDCEVNYWRRTITITTPQEDAARALALSVAHKLQVFPVKKEPFVDYANRPTTRYHVQPVGEDALKYIFVGEGLPETCHVEYDDVEVPAQPAKITKKARIVCDVPDTEEEAFDG